MDLENSRITTISGKQFYLADPRPEAMDMEDVIWALSRICRYGGHLDTKYQDAIYSVLQHSVYVLWIMRKLFPHHVDGYLWALLHDATEAWYGDIVSPLKRMFPEYRALEDCAAVVVQEAFNIPYNPTIGAMVHRADQMCWRLECVLVSANPDALLEGEPLSPFTMLEIDPDFRVWSPTEARARFREELANLYATQPTLEH